MSRALDRKSKANRRHYPLSSGASTEYIAKRSLDEQRLSQKTTPQSNGPISWRLGSKCLKATEVQKRIHCCQEDWWKRKPDGPPFERRPRHGLDVCWWSYLESEFSVWPRYGSIIRQKRINRQRSPPKQSSWNGGNMKKTWWSKGLICRSMM